MTPPRSMSPTEHHRHVGGLGKAHIGDVAGPQIDLGRAARALDEDDVGVAREPREALEHRRQQLGACAAAYSRACSVPSAGPARSTCAPVSVSGFSSTGFMCTLGATPRGARLQRLRAADLAAVGGDRGVVRHVLRLERRDPQAAPHERPAQPGDDQRLADIRAGALDHHGGRAAHQNSIPCCAFTPGAERMLDQLHLGDQVGDLDQLVLGVAAGDDRHACRPASRRAGTPTTSSTGR